MDITFDSAKDRENQAKHGVSLGLAAEFEWDEAVTWEDVRRTYGETRKVSIGYMSSSMWIETEADVLSACVRLTRER